jgi:hypothetical protein
MSDAIKILTIKADKDGNKLFIKHFSKMNNRMFCEYKSTYNDMPFQHVELFFDDKGNVTILDGTGVVMWRFSYELIKLYLL